MARAVRRFPEFCYSLCISHEHQLFLESIAGSWNTSVIPSALQKSTWRAFLHFCSPTAERGGSNFRLWRACAEMCFFNSFQTWQISACLGMNLGQGEDLVNEIVVSFPDSETCKGFKLFPYQKGTVSAYFSCRHIICLHCFTKCRVTHSSFGGDSYAMLCELNILRWCHTHYIWVYGI